MKIRDSIEQDFDVIGSKHVVDPSTFKHLLHKDIFRSKTATDREGHVCAIFFFIKIHDARAMGMAFFSEDCTRKMLPIVRAAKLEIEKMKAEGIKRFEMAARVDFPQAIKFARAIGFKKEALLRNYDIDSCDAWGFSIING